MSAARTAWLIGASRGMGFETAKLLSQQGWNVVLSARNKDKLQTACDAIGAKAYPLDITDPDAVRDCCTQVFSSEQPDLVMLNAGDYQPMTLAEYDISLFEKLNQVNYLGVVYVLGAVLPAMREHNVGEVIVNASSAAYRGLPNGAPYSAPKAATLNLVESLRSEAALWNINLRVINLGFVRSSLTDKNRFPMPAIMEPADAAQRIVANIGKSQFEITFPRRFTFFLKLLRCMPYAVYFALTRRLVNNDG